MQTLTESGVFRGFHGHSCPLCQGGQGRRLWTGRQPHTDRLLTLGQGHCINVTVTSVVLESCQTLASPPNSAPVFKSLKSCQSTSRSVIDRPPEWSSSPGHPGGQLAGIGLSKLQDSGTHQMAFHFCVNQIQNNFQC